MLRRGGFGVGAQKGGALCNRHAAGCAGARKERGAGQPPFIGDGEGRALAGGA
jgi:hypothetical protein